MTSILHHQRSIIAIAAMMAIGTERTFADPPASQPAQNQTPQAQPPQPAVVSTPNQPTTPGILGDWLGDRSHLVAKGFTAAAAIYYDYSRNFRGGLSTSQDVNREFFDLDLTLTTDQALHWHGGTFFLNFLDHQGPDGTSQLVGDAQGFVNEDGPHSTQLYQFYYQQSFASDQFRFKIGRIDSTTDFAYVANSAAFLGSSFGYSPNILSFGTYPDPALGAALFWTPDDHLYATFGIADANRTDRFGILAGHPYQLRPTAGGVLLMEETGIKWTLGKEDLAGRLAGGPFFHTGTFERFDDRSQTGAGGFFGVLDQTIIQLASPNNDGTGGRGVGLFGQFAYADHDVSSIDEHIGAGASWTGPIPGNARAADVLGLGAAFVHFSDRASLEKDHELAIEGFYKLQITPWFNVQPDIQYIINPGGTGTRDALVGTLRAELDF